MNKEYVETPTIGEIIREEFLEPLDITPYRLSKELKVFLQVQYWTYFIIKGK